MNHILLSEDYRGIEENITVARFLLSQQFFDSIESGFQSSMKFYRELTFSQNSNSDGDSHSDQEYKKKYFDRCVRIQLRFMQLVQGLYSYFVTGKPSFHLNRSMGKEGELKVQEFYDRIVENYDSFDDFYSTSGFKQVKSFNAMYLRSNRKLFHARFKQSISTEYLRFLLDKVQND